MFFTRKIRKKGDAHSITEELERGERKRDKLTERQRDIQRHTDRQRDRETDR